MYTFSIGKYLSSRTTKVHPNSIRHFLYSRCFLTTKSAPKDWSRAAMYDKMGCPFIGLAETVCFGMI